jgi:hypothetical protein
MTFKWWGREPALWIQGVAATLAALIVFGVPGLDDQVAAGVTGVLTAGAAALTAKQVRPIAPSIFGALVSAVAGLVGTIHLYDVTQQQLGAIQLAIAAGVVLVTRPQQEPRPAAPDPDPPGLVSRGTGGPAGTPPTSPRKHLRR